VSKRVNFTSIGNMTSKYNSVSLAKLFAGIDCVVAKSFSEVIITGLANDSRKVKPGDLFFAVPGFVTDGNRFIPEAISLGAKIVVTQSDVSDVESLPIVKCKDIKKTMSVVANRFFGFPSIKIPTVGITGTNGKTTVSYLFTHIMDCCGEKWGRIGTVEYYTGKRTVSALNTTPDALELQALLAEMIDSGMNGCVMEVSSHALDQGRCDDIEFSGAVFTNLTQDHLDYHKDMESYFGAKSILFSKLLRDDGFAVLNIDDPYSQKMKKLCRGKVLTFSVIRNSDQQSAADIKLIDDGFRDNHRYFKVSFQGRTLDGSMPLPGSFNLYNAAAAIGIAINSGCQLDDAVKALKTAPQVPGRVERVEAGQPFEVIVDYAHTPDALKNLLMGVETSGDKVLVFGCGGDRDRSKRSVMGEIAIKFANRVVVTSDNPRSEDPKRIINDILKGISKDNDFSVIEERDKAIGEALKMASPGDLVIIAGKGHEDYQVIDNRKLYFSDPDVVKKYLKKMGYAGS
jgi:UDP-N-acetylmuramoyl-L-alanyl-D-glutamate--2,6-diaminopimelate ligase